MPAASLRAAAAAVGFLTRIPVPLRLDGADVARGAPVFPLVGAGVGALAACVAWLASRDVPDLAAAAVAAAAVFLLTGAMHFDALADTFDAMGARTRERALEIMRDSRIGSFGATALALDVVLRVTLVAALVERHLFAGLVAAGALSRAAAVAVAAVLPYPRVEGGPGSVLTPIGRWTAAAAVALAVALSLPFVGVVPALVAAGTAVGLGLAYHAWLGGATGDMLGAVTEITELAVLFAVVA